MAQRLHVPLPEVHSIPPCTFFLIAKDVQNILLIFSNVFTHHLFSLQNLAELVVKQADDIKQLKILNRELKSNERIVWERLERITLGNGVVSKPEKSEQSSNFTSIRGTFQEIHKFSNFWGNIALVVDLGDIRLVFPIQGGSPVCQLPFLSLTDNFLIIFPSARQQYARGEGRDAGDPDGAG